MPKPVHKPRVAVLSPFVDKRHGTERCLAEQIERLAGDYKIHLYSSRVEDIDLGKITWHRVPMPRGPHLFRYVWWLFANWFCRWRDRRFRGLAPDVVYSAGVNCLDADLVSVHVLFSKVRAQLGDGLSLKRNPLKAWPLMLHRRIYYRLIESLEDRLYNQEDITLVAVSQTGAQDIQDRFGRHDRLSVAYHGVDSVKFAPGRRQGLRKGARAALGLSDENFAVLLIGNDWRIKGLRCLLERWLRFETHCFEFLLLGRILPWSTRNSSSVSAWQPRFSFCHRGRMWNSTMPRPMHTRGHLWKTRSRCRRPKRCLGIAVIVSRAAGVSEIIHHGEDGLILEDPARLPEAR